MSSCKLAWEEFSGNDVDWFDLTIRSPVEPCVTFSPSAKSNFMLLQTQGNFKQNHFLVLDITKCFNMPAELTNYN